MTNYKIKKGVLYNGDEIESLDMNNLEQVRFVKYEIERIAMFQDGLPVEVNFDVTIEASINFKCKCGSNVYKSMDVDTEDEFDAEQEFVSKISRCRVCSTEYEYARNEDNDLIVRIYEKKVN